MPEVPEPSDDIWAAPEKVLTGVGFLFRELPKRGIRVYVELPNYLQGVVPHQYGLAFLDFPPGVGFAPKQVFNWRYQVRVGEDWSEEPAALKGAAGSLWEVLQEPQTKLQILWCIDGRWGKPTYELLECSACGVACMRPSKDANESQKVKCKLTVNCGGTYRRFIDPSTFEVVIPGRRASRGGGGKRQNISAAIRLEALELAEELGKMAEAARQMSAKYPEFKIDGAAISRWKKDREAHPENYVVDTEEQSEVELQDSTGEEDGSEILVEQDFADTFQEYDQ